MSFIQIRLLLLISLSLVFVGQANADLDQSNPTILVVGDSLSAGFGMNLEQSWVNLLQSRLKQEGYGYKVVNASITGNTTGNGLARLPRAVEVHRPEIVLIELGGNDGLRGLPVKVMRDNLQKMIELAKQNGAKVLLAGIQIPPNYGEDYAVEFADVYPELVDQYELAFIPFFLKNVALNPKMMQADGIHPSVEAQPLLVNNVWEFLEPMLSKSAVVP